MQLILAELCGRWGCSWQEGLLTVIFMTFGFPVILIVLGLLSSGVLLLLAGDETAVSSTSNESKSQQQNLPKLDKVAVNNLVKPQPQRKRILTTARFLGRTLKNISKD